MSDSHEAKTKDRQAAALVASGGIILSFVLYWVVQVQGVREMLELAYG